MSIRFAYTEARRDLAELLNRVQYGGVRIIVHRRGKDAAAVVPVSDLKLIEALEDHLEEEWAKAVAEQALAEGGEPIPYEELRRELDLE